VCRREWAKIGGVFHDPNKHAHILDPADIR